KRGYPEFTKTRPREITAPAPSSAPPVAMTPFTVTNGFAESKSQRTLPSAVEKARRCPSIDPEKTTPGTTATAAGCAGLQPSRGGSHGLPGTNQILFPLSRLSAVSPPP